MNPLDRLRQARRLYQTDRRADTFAALVLIGVVVYPVVQMYRQYRRVRSD
jgi:hypothetical protein